MKLSWLCVLALLAGAACGLQPVELYPATSSVGADEFVVGQVPAQALARLRSQRTELGPEMLRLLYPAAPELIVPADLAPIAFEWVGQPKAKAPAMPMAMPPEPQPAAAGHTAPMPAEMMGGPMADKAKEKADKPDKQKLIAYELRAHSELADVRVYVAAETASIPPERWRSLLRAHSGSTLSIEIRGVYDSGELVHAMPLQLRVRAAMSGLFYNFSAKSQGLTRGQLADTHERTEPVPAPLEPAVMSRCVGCHAVSHNGERVLAASVAPPALLRWSASNDEAPLWFDWPGAVRPEPDYIQASFDATAARIAATRAGQLVIFNADTGAVLEQTGMPLMAAVSAPDWSPDGRSIVVETARAMSAPEGGSLATLQVGWDGSLSALMPLINATGDERLRAPSYSPDSEWIAYERRMGPPGDAKDSKLFLVRARGGEPIELRALAQGVRPMDGASAPTFAPGDAPGHVYLLFSSPRPVGGFMLAEGQRQLFAAELDLSLAAKGEDPSHAAFWLPFQQLTNSYLRTQWAPALATCTESPKEVCGDKADDDCDGEVDEEDCCAPAAESCGDLADNDCDSAVDEGCDCAFQEACGNLKDDDCDLKVDEKPCMPAPPMR